MPAKTEVTGLIAERIRRLRGELRLRQEEFAERLGQDQTTISKWERAKARPTPEALTRLAGLAEGVEKLFFLEHAGLPKEYLMGEPMIPEIHAASSRVIQKAMKPTKNGSHSEPQDQPSWDRELMTLVIETVNQKLRAKGKKLSDRKYAELIVLMYDFCYKTRRPDSDMVERFLKIA